MLMPYPEGLQARVPGQSLLEIRTNVVSRSLTAGKTGSTVNIVQVEEGQPKTPKRSARVRPNLARRLPGSLFDTSREVSCSLKAAAKRNPFNGDPGMA